MSKQAIYPTLRYDDALAAISWLEAVLGFERHEVYPGEAEGTVAHAQLRFGDDLVMLATRTEAHSDTGIAWTYLVVDADAVDDAYARARAAGAEVTQEITDQEYGSRDFTVRDPEGHLWSVGTYQPSVR